MYEELLIELHSLLKLQRVYCDSESAARWVGWADSDYRRLHNDEGAFYAAQEAFEQRLERITAWLPAGTRMGC